MKSKKTNKAKTGTTKTKDKSKKHKKLTLEKLKIIKGGQVIAPGGCSGRMAN